MQNAIGYLRVSTAGQVEDGVSLDAQRAKVEAWALANDYELLGVQVDAGLSGGRADNRPGLQKAIAEACRHKAALVVYSLSRLARSTRDTLAIGEQLDRAGADLVSLSEKIDTTSAAGKMVFRMLAVLSEFERDQISERTKSALQHMRAQGCRVSGRIPYGFDLDSDGKRLVPNEAEQTGIATMRRLRAEGQSLRKIAEALRAEGIETKSGNLSWTAQALKVILDRQIRPQ